jgi:hypothetical protein
VQLEEQAQELLARGQYSEALSLADVCAAAGSDWPQTAFVEAACLLMEGTAADVVQHGSTGRHGPPSMVQRCTGASKEISLWRWLRPRGQPPLALSGQRRRAPP